MQRYYVDRNPQATAHGEHEVHRTDAACDHSPAMENRVDLGFHSSCGAAVTEAERLGYRPADGCAHCNVLCHTG